MTITIPEKCPSCEADLTEPGSLQEYDLLPVWYGGVRTDSGEWDNDGDGFDWIDDGRDSHIICTKCTAVVSPSARIQVSVEELERIAQVGRSSGLIALLGEISLLKERAWKAWSGE